MTLVLEPGLFVSCQARPPSPMDSADSMARFARAAVLGGACGIRAQGVGDIAAIKEAVPVPVIGLIKTMDRPVYITPTIEAAVAVASAGADAVAVDATLRPRPDGMPTEEFLARLRDAVDIAVIADVDTVEAAVAAERAGVDVVATTLAGYTQVTETRPRTPDLTLLEEIVAEVSIPTIAEGRFRTADQVRRAFELGAFAVVVGGAITDPVALTRRFAAAVPARRTNDA